MADLKLWLLGPPKIEIEGAPLQVDTRKATALLVYLAVNGETQRRESLATLLWPESDNSHAKAALRRTLSALRKALGGEWVSADRDNISLEAPWLDTAEFRELSLRSADHDHRSDRHCERCERDLVRAAGLYRGDFLQGFSLADSPDYDDWEYFTGQEFQREYSDVLRRLVAIYRAASDNDKAIEYAHRLLALDTLNEGAHRELMALYALTDRRDLAIQQYRECVRILQEELGAPPLEETVELHERIKRGELAELAPPSALPPRPRNDACLPYSRSPPTRRHGSRDDIAAVQTA